MISRVLLYVGGGVIIAGGLALWVLWAHLQDAQAEAHLWQQNAETAAATAIKNAATVGDLRRDLAVRDRLLTERDQALAALGKNNDAMRRELARAKQEASDEIRACFALPVPDAVDRILREYPAAVSAGAGGGKADATGAAAAGLSATAVGR